MTDRELLELAARAAEIDAEWHCPCDEVEEHADYLASTEGMWLKGERSPDNSKYWNPLTDDGDALRLAAKLLIDTTFIKNCHGYSVLCRSPLYVTMSGESLSAEFDERDQMKATKRAIVRAAAVIGKQKG